MAGHSSTAVEISSLAAAAQTMSNPKQAVDAKAEVYLGARTSGTGSPVDIDPGASGTGILFKLEGINLTVGVRQRILAL